MKPRGALAIAALLSCSRSTNPPAPTAVPVDPLAPLRTFEEEQRKATSFLEQPAQDRAFGADPYAVVALGDGKSAGVLRGRDALVLLDASLAEIARAPTPRAPSALAVQGDTVLVASELEPRLARYRVHTTSFEPLPDLPLPSAFVRDVATAESTVFVVEERDDRLVEIAGARVRTFPVPRGPARLARSKDALFVASVLGHAVTRFPLDRDGRVAGAPVTATIDGPIWGLAAHGDVVVAGGAEDHPLDRRGGFFGWIDSFVYGWRYEDGALKKLYAVNVSEHGLIVPKAIALSLDGATALVTSYGGDRALRLGAKDGAVLESFAFPPGASAVAANGVAANPLLDAWVTKDRVVHVEPKAARTERERLGEALFFTGLMAPASSSDGAKSRFSCETCHFEGYVDGRVHHTGRGDVRATTKPLVGLFNNRPHFSRALDPDLSAVAENEFRVAGAPSKTDPHWDLDVEEVPWLAGLRLEKKRWDQAELRVALMSFLMAFSHRTNPNAAARAAFTAEERRGAELFRDRCERCHAARASADDPASRVAFERWERLVLEGGALVWGSEAYEKTGVVPYVHDRGARVPSLRRLYKKRPYFTNGSAPTIPAALELVRLAPFSHAGGDGSSLTADESRALAAFLDLL
ncbi:MAG: hypothetical protein KIT84_20425 [Labilithrix sp.]|nr:hypothetical protein [Labilithrix sp.]MCW5813406.1 hypothetical protein [Labilithrix sp.]